jgi:hypothetical protein
VSKSNFRDLFNFCDNTVVHDKNRKIKKKDLITFLIKLKYDLSDDLLKVLLSYNSRVSVRTSLSQRFVLENLGPASIFLLYFANQLYNPDPENRRAIIYVDGTYLKIPKSSNFRSLPQSYCLHKGYHLLKPALVVAPDGYILDVDGPYFSDSRNNDAAMLQDHLENQELQDANQLRQWLEEDDIKIVNRGYRDATNLLGYLGLECKIPPLLLRGQRQYSTEEANTARLITKTQWIVEAQNGHIKLLFKFFRGQIPIHHVPHIGSYFRIACAIINRYFPPIEMQGATAELADSMRELAEHENVVKARVEIDRLHLQRIRDDVWINLDQIGLPEFPFISLQELRDLTIEIYQIKLAPSYIQDRLQRENNNFIFQIFLQKQGFLRARIYSRYTQATEHQLWIAFRPQFRNENEDEDNHQEERAIDGCYCTCKSGSRTVGCCAHVTSVIWYLGYARHQENVRYQSTKILHSVLDAGRRNLPQF